MVISTHFSTSLNFSLSCPLSSIHHDIPRQKVHFSKHQDRSSLNSFFFNFIFTTQIPALQQPSSPKHISPRRAGAPHNDQTSYDYVWKTWRRERHSLVTPSQRIRYFVFVNRGFAQAAHCGEVRTRFASRPGS